MLELQRFLDDQGYFSRLSETPDGYTGYFGELTKEALQAWQEDYHLTADGRFGQSCRQAVVRCQVGMLALALPVVMISMILAQFEKGFPFCKNCGFTLQHASGIEQPYRI